MSESDSITSATRTCTKCGREHPATLEYFHARKRGKYGLHNWCRECRAAYAAAYRAEHRDEMAAHQAVYNAEHREERSAYRAAHYAEHRDESAAYERNRKARKLGNGGKHDAADVRAQYARQNGRCYWCRDKVGDTYHVDHVMPVILGGSNGPENLVISCPTCNLSKGAKHPQEFSGRLL